MQVHAVQPPQWVGTILPIAVILVVVALRLRSARKTRPLKLERLWVVPVLYLAVAVMMFIQLPPRGWVALASLVGLALGAVVGWQRGKMMQITVDPQTHELNQKASPAAMLFLIVLIAVRAGTPAFVGIESHVSPAMLTDPLIAFALGMFTLQRVEMYIRAKRLLEEVRRGVSPG